jgi:pimeloyl-ACP methyl ester carboxylesterase
MSFLVSLPAEFYDRKAFARFSPGPFSIGTARAMAWLSQLAYEDEPKKIDPILRDWGIRRVASFDHLISTPLPMVRTRGFVGERLGAWFVVFEGTDPLVVANWVTNFTFVPDQDGIHRGFGSALAAAWQEIAGALSQAGPKPQLYVTGHSLGGALAVLCALRAARELAAAAQAVYTFGMPRVGNRAFAAAYDQVLGENTYRLVHGEDIVPTVPPSELRFAHVGRILPCARHARFDPVLLSPKGADDPPFAATLLDGLKVGLLQLLSGSLAPAIRRDPLGQASRLLPPAIADHLPDRYWGALAAGDAVATR